MAVRTVRTPVYDSSRRSDPLTVLRNGLAHRDLVVLLARRDLANRYGGAVLGPWWSLATPLAYAVVLWSIFSGLHSLRTENVPFVVYVLSGVALLTFVTQTIFTVTSSIIVNTVSLRRVFVPVGTFAAAAAISTSVTLGFTTGALLVIQAIAGASVPWTVVLLPPFCVLLTAGVAGFGLAVGALATVFADAVEATRALLTVVGFATPVFYPASIVPERFRFVLELNPLYHFLAVFRYLDYGGTVPSAATFTVCLATPFVCMFLGAGSFTLVRRMLPTVL